MKLSRRRMLSLASTAMVAAGLNRDAFAAFARNEICLRSDLVKSIQKEVVFNGRDGKDPTWFHPRCCVIPIEMERDSQEKSNEANANRVFMTLQTIMGSDYFGPVHWTHSDDLGKTWAKPEPVDSLGRVDAGERGEEGVCDVVPEWHAPTLSVLALGHNVFYKGPRFSREQPARWPIYSVYRDGKWGPRRKLEWDDPRGSMIYSNNCGQRVTLDNGDVLLAFSFGSEANEARQVAGVHCSFDGEQLRIKKVGEPLQLNHRRGLLEPSLIEFDGRYFLTIRAEDDHGYASVSRDGLTWSDKVAWAWDNGDPVKMSTTQQHWLRHRNGLFLVYTREHESNKNVIRWRAPLFMAQVDLERLCLIRETERVVLPLVGDGVDAPNEVALMGNFHPVEINEQESWVTVGEWKPRADLKGDLLLSRITWNEPNE